MNKEVDIVEIMLISFPVLIMITIICLAIQQNNKTCVEYKEIPVTNCYSAGGGYTCEYVTKRSCIKYE